MPKSYILRRPCRKKKLNINNLRNTTSFPALFLRISLWPLKWYYDQKITFIFSSDFETMFVKHSPSEIISVNFEKKTVNLNCNFPV